MFILLAGCSNQRRGVFQDQAARPRLKNSVKTCSQSRKGLYKSCQSLPQKISRRLARNCDLGAVLLLMHGWAIATSSSIRHTQNTGHETLLAVSGTSETKFTTKSTAQNTRIAPCTDGHHLKNFISSYEHLMKSCASFD